MKIQPNNYSSMKVSGVFFLICLSLYTIITVTPILGEKVGIWVFSTSVFLLLFSALIYNNNVKRTNTKIILTYVLLMAQITLYKVSGVSTCTWGRVFSYGVTYIILVLIPLFLSYKSFKLDRYYIFIFSLITLVNIVDNIRLLILYPGASEAINFEWGEQFRSMNIGGTQFVCFIMLFGLFILMTARNNTGNNRFNKALLYGLFLISFFYILMSGRAIALFSYVIGSLLIVFYSNNFLKKNLLLIFFAFSVVFLFIFIYIKEISFLLELYLESDRLSSRLQEAASLGASDTSSGSALGRLEFYWMSISTFFESPINFFFGVGDEISDVPIMNRKGIGGHSGFFDFAAEYGAVGVFLLAKLFTLSYKVTYKKVKHIAPTSVFIFLVFIVNGFINNPLTVSSLTLIFIVIPSYILLLKDKNNSVRPQSNSSL